MIFSYFKKVKQELVFQKLIFIGRYFFYKRNFIVNCIKLKLLFFEKLINLKDYFLEELVDDLIDYPENLLKRKKKAIRKFLSYSLILFNLILKLKKKQKIYYKSMNINILLKYKNIILNFFKNFSLLVQIMALFKIFSYYLNFYSESNILLTGIELLTSKMYPFMNKFLGKLKFIQRFGVDIRALAIYKTFSIFRKYFANSFIYSKLDYLNSIYSNKDIYIIQ